MKLLILYSCLLAILIGCFYPEKEDKFSFKEIKRISSPDSRVEAVLVEFSGGATVGNSAVVYLLEKGEPIKESTGSLFTSDHFYGVDIEWKANKNLVIKYEKARIFKFSNFWNPSLDSWDYIVEITLQCLSPDGQLREEDKHPMRDIKYQ